MRILKTSLLGLGGATVLFVCVSSTLLWMASSQPVQYVPVQLSPSEQDVSMHEFFYRLQEFGNQAGAGVPFRWSLTQEQINSYIASMDAIEALTNRPTHPSAQFKALGLSAPAVALHDGRITLMIYLDRYQKVASADVAVDYDKQGNLRAEVLALRIGLVQVPQWAWAGSWHRAQQELADQLSRHESFEASTAEAEGTSSRGGIAGPPVSVAKVGRMLARILEMLQGNYVRPEVIWPLGRHHVLIDEVRLEDGRLTIHASPVNPATAATATAARPAGG